MYLGSLIVLGRGGTQRCRDHAEDAEGQSGKRFEREGREDHEGRDGSRNQDGNIHSDTSIAPAIRNTKP
jgi:hypothetical protein